MRFLTDIRECPVAVVTIQNIFSVVAYEEIFIAVVVIVSDANALSPSCMRQARFLGNVGKSSVVIIVVQVICGLLFAGKRVESRSIHDKNIRPAIVVIIEYGHACAGSLEDEFLGVHAAEGVTCGQAGLASFIHEIGDLCGSILALGNSVLRTSRTNYAVRQNQKAESPTRQHL